MIASLFGPDLGYVVIIVLVVLVGGSQLPKLARNIGTVGKEFRKAQHEAEEEAQRQQTAQPRPVVATAPALRSVSAGSPKLARGAGIAQPVQGGVRRRPQSP